MRSASPKPAVVTSTTGSPLRVSSALVATVVPTFTAVTARDAAHASRIARAAPRPGSPAAPPALAEGTLRTCSSPAGERPMTSVNVPPRSSQNGQPAAERAGGRDDWLNVSIACIIRAYDSSSQRRACHAGARGFPPCGLFSRPGERALGTQDLRARGGRAQRRLRGALGRLPRDR